MKKFIIFMLCVIGVDIILAFPQMAHAETRVYGDYLYTSDHWTASSSPYILEENLTVPRDWSLTVDPDVIIDADPSLDAPPSLYVNGYLSLNGTAGHPITVKGISAITIDHGTTSVNYTNISIPSGIYLENAYASIGSSTISNAQQGLYVSAGTLDVTGSRITNNQYGVIVQPPVQVFPEIANASVTTTSVVLPADVSIHDSSLSGNSSAAIENNDTSTVEATDNWWGSKGGPSISASGASSNASSNTSSSVSSNESSGIVGPVNYTPWLDHDPFATSTPCCSSILFIPGLEGSWLYRTEYLPLRLGTTTNTLWAPNRNSDVQKLFLDSSGSSTDVSIYSGDPIDSVFGVYDVYGSFMDYLNGLVSKGIVNEWKSFGYDWRKPISQVVTGMEKKATTTDSLVQTVLDLASKSKTGKVTIIAHSNGGLVAKYLVKTLVDLGKQTLIDSVISVAVPYLGTPQAVLSLLHGDGQSIAYGLILKASVARQLGQNMASAYSLLPSNRYFSFGMGPTITFASTTIQGINNSSYPQAINSSNGQDSFITDSHNSRHAPEDSDTSLPIKGNASLMASANGLHSLLDAFSWPVSIARYAIMGWHQITAKGIEYYEKTSCRGTLIGFWCGTVPAYRATTTIEGDNTVVTGSAGYDDGTPIYLDLKSISDNEHKNIIHANILESSTTEAVINDVVTHSSSSNDNAQPIQSLSSLPGVTVGAPPIDSQSSFLVVSTHSPVELNIYDQNGNHTGPIPAPADIQDDVVSAYEEKIPGSRFESYANNDTDSDTYIYVPDDSNRKYSIAINGVGVGSFTFDVQKVVNGSTVDSVEYSNIPVTPLSAASTTISLNSSANGGILLASSTALLTVDIDGDGSVDLNVKPNTQVDASTYLESLKRVVTSVLGPGKRCDEFKTRIDHFEDLWKKGKLRQTRDFSSKFMARFAHKRLKDTPTIDKEKIINEVDSFIGQFE